MSTNNNAESDVWERLADSREALEMCVEEDVPFSARAEKSVISRKQKASIKNGDQKYGC